MTPEASPELRPRPHHAPAPAPAPADDLAPADGSPPADRAPDWETFRDEVACPLCGYNLRGLGAPVCPECGYRFQWRALLDEDVKLHPYLFEHHPERDVSSFWETLVGGLRPERFWSTLRPQQPSAPRRLALYATAVSFALLLGAIAVAATARPNGRAVWSALYSGLNATGVFRVSGAGFSPVFALAVWLGFLQQGRLYSPGVFVALMAWPWLTLASLLVFAQSMGRAKVRKVHVARCVIYSADVLVWAGGAAVVLAIGMESGVRWPRMGTTAQAWLLLALGAATWAAAAWRLAHAYALYLRFHRPLLTVLASQVIVFLALIVVATTLWGR